MILANQRRIAWSLAAATLVPLAALAWLGLRTVRQDRDVERQRWRERLEVAAARVALDIDRRLQEVEQGLAAGAGIRMAPTGLIPGADSTLLYQPTSEAVQRPSAALEHAEDLEFQRHDLAAAVAAYRLIARSADHELRAAALVRLGRVLRQSRDRDGALDAYTALVQLGSVAVGDQPAALIGHQGRCKVFQEFNDAEPLRRAGADLARTLYAGGWSIDRATFDLYRDMLRQWGADAPAVESVARTEAAIQLWRSWRAGDLTARGRRLFRVEGAPVLAVWSGGPEHPALWLTTSSEIEETLAPVWKTQELDVSLSDTDGHLLLGRSRAGSISLTPGETHLPFVLSITSATLTDPRDETRRMVLIAGLALMFGVILVAAYGVYRTTSRELMLARQQADFVSAVSHEFRTPLTSMRHLTDLLVSRSVPTDERKAYYYELLARETERLHRMVESLLSFGRMEAGAYAWQLESVDGGGLVRTIVDDFRAHPLATHRRIDCEIDDDLPSVRVDREALSRAIWNLLENAAKYSDAGRPIHVFARRQRDFVLIGIGDEGIGVPAGERERIFQKFVRGADAKRAGIRGVGIGLALVQRIVEAHGGSVRLESEPGRGSTFTVSLPVVPEV